jgi:hypothetical protein
MWYLPLPAGSRCQLCKSAFSFSVDLPSQFHCLKVTLDIKEVIVRKLTSTEGDFQIIEAILALKSTWMDFVENFNNNMVFARAVFRLSKV